jgi:alpha-L-fucosidase 2
VREALSTLRAGGAAFEVLAQDHRAWWHDYYRKSFLSIPDGRLQSFYWIQLYKVASAAREKAPVMATSGPWLEPTPWPATWWNLNVQLEYWLIHGSNHLELDAVTYSLDKFRDRLVDQVAEPYRSDSAGIPRTTDMTLLNGSGTGTSGYAVGIPGQDPPTPEVGNLTWALHNVWLSYRHTMDEHIMRDVLFPLLRRAINYYLHFLTKGGDGKLHLPPTFSPEYGVNAPDCNYDLSLIRWGCRTLIDSAKLLRIDDPLAKRWQEVLDTLVSYPVDANGYMIGAGVPFAKSHRHYSHMLQVYPLYEITWEQPQHRELIAKSLDHWVSFEGALQGYTFTGAASMSAQMLRGDKAEFYLGEVQRRFIQPNTMYEESGPVIETPLSAAQSLHDMLCQSWGGVIRLFPAVPTSWKDVVLHDFRTQGAFLISAVRKGGVTQWLRVRSEAGAPCVLRPGIAGDLTVRDRRGGQLRWQTLPGGDIQVELRRGEEAVVYRKGDRPDFSIAPVAPNGPSTPWGLPPEVNLRRGPATTAAGRGPATRSEGEDRPGLGLQDASVGVLPAEGHGLASPVALRGHGHRAELHRAGLDVRVAGKLGEVTVRRGEVAARLSCLAVAAGRRIAPQLRRAERADLLVRREHQFGLARRGGGGARERDGEREAGERGRDDDSCSGHASQWPHTSDRHQSTRR